jgi:hypothetical protein
MPVRPIINWRYAPAYNLAQHLVKILTTYIPLPYIFNVKNLIHLKEDLLQIPYNTRSHLRLASHRHIQHLFQYPNKNVNTTHYFRIQLKQRKQESGTGDHQTHEDSAETKLLSILHTNQRSGHGGPHLICSLRDILAVPGTYRIFDKILQHKITWYYGYVNDILLIYDTRHTDVHDALNQFNKINSKMQFTLEQEENNAIHFLDLTISRTDINVQFSIYRKPTTRNAIIPSDSYHPSEHKINSIGYLHNRNATYMTNQISSSTLCKQTNTTPPLELNTTNNRTGSTTSTEKIRSGQSLHTSVRIPAQ